MKIILLGYMACGKSTLGKLLSSSLNINFIDLDHFIEKKNQCSVSELFKTKGELFFRKEERSCLLELLYSKDSFVLSIGGGTPCYYENMDAILKSKTTISFYLRTDIPELVRRIISEKDQRPLVSHLKTKEELAEFVGKHLFERSYFYNKADFVIQNQGDKEEIIQKIVAKLY
jgi:shikimate kinase